MISPEVATICLENFTLVSKFGTMLLYYTANSLPSHHPYLYGKPPEPKKYSDWSAITTVVRLNKMKEVKDSRESGIHSRHNRGGAV